MCENMCEKQACQLKSQHITGHSPALKRERGYRRSSSAGFLQLSLQMYPQCEQHNAKDSLCVSIGILNVSLSRFCRFDKNLLTRCGKSQTELKVKYCTSFSLHSHIIHIFHVLTQVWSTVLNSQLIPLWDILVLRYPRVPTDLNYKPVWLPGSAVWGCSTSSK